MANIIFPKRWTMKPPVGSQINRGHPSAQNLQYAFLANEGAGLRLNDAAGSGAYILAADGQFVSRGGEMAFQFGASNPSNIINDIDWQNQRISIIVCYEETRVDGYGAAFGISQGSNNPLSLNYNASSLIKVISVTNSPFNNDSTVLSEPPVKNTRTVWALTMGQGGINVYRDGRKVYTFAAGTGTLYPYGTSNLALLCSNATGIGATNGYLFYSYVWKNRELSAAEIQQLYVEPYSLLQPQQVARRYFIPQSPPSLTAMLTRLTPRKWTMKPPVGTRVNWGHSLAKDLSWAFMFNEGAGQAPTDLVSGARLSVLDNAASGGPTVENTPNGSGYLFSGTYPSSFVSPLIGGKYDNQYVCSISMWAKVDALQTGSNQALFSRSLSIHQLYNAHNFQVWIPTSGVYSSAVSPDIVAGVWYHIVAVFNGLTGAPRIYINGVDATISNQVGSGTADNSATQATIGTYDGGATAKHIREIAHWNRALSPAEINQLYVDPYCFMQSAPRIRLGSTILPSVMAMLARLTPRKWSMKPPAGTQLQYGNPLLVGLKECIFFNEGGGTPTNLASPTLVPSLVGTAAWVSGLVGTGVHGNSATNQVRIADSSLNYAAGDFTFRTVFTPVTWTGAFTDTFMKGNEFRLFFDTSGNLSLAAMGGTDGGTCSTGMTAGGTYDFVITRSGSTCICYVNGVNKGTFTNGNTALQSAIFQYGGDGNRGSQGDVTVYTHNFWTRALSPAEIQELYVNPYTLLRGAPRIRLGSTTASSGLITVTAVYLFLQEALLTASLVGKSEQEATGIVSKAWASAHEALALLSKSGLHQHEAMILSKNILLHLQEALQTASQQRLSSQEASGTVTRAVSHVQEALSKLASSYTSQQESLLSASKVYTSEQEALKGLQQAVSSLQEASGTVKRIVTSEQEAIAYTKTANLSYQESLSSLSKVYTAVHEALKTASLVGSGFQEAKGIVTVLLSSIQEAKAYITTVSLGEQETLKPVSVQLNSVQEALKGLSKTLATSQEALGGVKKTTTHSQEAQAILVLSALLVEAARVVLTLLLEQTSATPTLEFEMTQEEV